MEIRQHRRNDRTYIEVLTLDKLIASAQEALDVLADLYYQGAEGLILKKEQLDPSFFNLRSGLAGEILQKCSNYRMKMAIIGDYSNISEGALRDFIYESNKGTQILFVAKIEEALERWSQH